jgi:hypothetical protein
MSRDGGGGDKRGGEDETGEAHGSSEDRQNAGKGRLRRFRGTLDSGDATPIL